MAFLVRRPVAATQQSGGNFRPGWHSVPAKRFRRAMPAVSTGASRLPIAISEIPRFGNLQDTGLVDVDTADLHSHTYPKLYFNNLGCDVMVLQDEPPVYLAKGILNEEMCQAIIETAEENSMEPVEYEQKILVNTERLKLLIPLIWVAAIPPVMDSFHRGASGFEIVATGAGALLAATGFAGALTLIIRRCVEEAIGGRVFVGSKWAGATAKGAAAEAIEIAIAKIERLTQRSRTCFEPALVTRYRPGDRQRRHFDTPLPGDELLEEFANGLGSRLVQCVVYLNDLPKDGGGETMFHHPSLSGLKVAPSRGDCLLFFPCFEDGRADLRMEHSGEPVKHGTKYILNTWVCQNDSDSLSHPRQC